MVWLWQPIPGSSRALAPVQVEDPRNKFTRELLALPKLIMIGTFQIRLQVLPNQQTQLHSSMLSDVVSMLSRPCCSGLHMQVEGLQKTNISYPLAVTKVTMKCLLRSSCQLSADHYLLHRWRG